MNLTLLIKRLLKDSFINYYKYNGAIIYRPSIYDRSDFVKKSDLLIFNTPITKWIKNGNFRYNFDPISKIEISKYIPSKLIKLKYYKGLDIKYLWELGRLSFLTNYFDYIDIDKLTETVKNFLVSNRVGFGPQWMCPMDVGLRAIYIYEIICFLKVNKKLKSDIEDLFINSIYKHVIFVYNNLEINKNSDYQGNHYLTNICCLVVLSSKFLHDNRMEEIFHFSVREFYFECIDQFNDDGTNIENSTSYHRYCLELVFYTLHELVGINNSENKFSKIVNSFYGDQILQLKPFEVILKGGHEFLEDTSHKGETFFIGDNDSGNIMFNLSKKVISLLDINIKKYKKEHLLDKYFNQDISKIYPCEIKNYNKIDYPDFGVTIFKSDNFYLSIRTNYCNKKLGHAHQDILSINLVINDNVIFRDSGTATYTRDKNLRNIYRSVISHNSPILEDYNLSNLSVFNFKYSGTSSMNKVSSNSWIYYYKVGDTLYWRRISLFMNGILIEDSNHKEMINLQYCPYYGFLDKY